MRCGKLTRSEECERRSFATNSRESKSLYISKSVRCNAARLDDAQQASVAPRPADAKESSAASKVKKFPPQRSFQTASEGNRQQSSHFSLVKRSLFAYSRHFRLRKPPAKSRPAACIQDRSYAKGRIQDMFAWATYFVSRQSDLARNAGHFRFRFPVAKLPHWVCPSCREVCRSKSPTNAHKHAGAIPSPHPLQESNL